MTARERLQNFLSEHPIIAKRSLGQNFLINDDVIEKMLEKLKSFSPSFIVEVGPGPGALTEKLTEYVGANEQIELLLIEFDTFIAEVWKTRGLNIIEQDALQFDWTSFQNKNNKVFISNLPYQISSSIVIDRCLDECKFDGMILMFQKEVGDRIRAKIKTSAYGFLSVMAQTFWKIEVVANLGRADFLPAPKVNSQVLAFKPIEIFIKSKVQQKKYLSFVKTAFSHRRKFLKSNLGQILKTEQINEVFLAAGISPNARAEEISVDKYVEMFQRLSHEYHTDHPRK